MLFRSGWVPRCCSIRAARQSGALGVRCWPRLRSALRADCPALLARTARRRTRCAHCVRYAQTTAPRMTRKRAARAAARPARLGATEASTARPEHPFAIGPVPPQAQTRATRPCAAIGVATVRPPVVARAVSVVAVALSPAPRVLACAGRRAAGVGGDFRGDEKRRPRGGARSALPSLTRRGCLSVANAVSAASSAARPEGEHRSAEIGRAHV